MSNEMDFVFENHSSIYLLQPRTKAAREWVDENISKEGYQPMWPTVLLEGRYVEPVLIGLVDAGLRFTER